jgi:integrase
MRCSQQRALESSDVLTRCFPDEEGHPIKITAKTVATTVLPEGKIDVVHFDDTLPGFGLRLRKSGEQVRRQFIVQYRAAGISRRLLLGSADLIGVEAARAEAKKVLGKVALGGDPQADKEQKRERDVFPMSALAAQYLEAKARSVRARTLVESTRYLTGDYFKPLHAMPVERITRRDVASRVLHIANERGQRTGAQARQQLSAMFTWAMQSGLAESNPVVGTAEPKSKRGARDRVLSDAELAAIWNAAGDGDFGKVVRLLILTGQRRNEVGGIAWSEINGSTWTIPATRTKNGRQHTLPLSGLALSIIESVPERVGRDQLWGERGSRGFSSWNDAKSRLDARIGGKVVKHWTLHDLRRSVATRMCDLGVMPHVVEQILNHQSGHRAGVVGTYNRSAYEQPVKAALALWADHIRTITGSRERVVVAFARDAI